MKRYYEVGDLIRISTGEYSDYCTGDTYKVTRAFDIKEYIDDYVLSCKEYKSAQKLFTHLTQVLPLKEIDVEEIWLGAYEVNEDINYS